MVTRCFTGTRLKGANGRKGRGKNWNQVGGHGHTGGRHLGINCTYCAIIQTHDNTQYYVRGGLRLSNSGAFIGPI